MKFPHQSLQNAIREDSMGLSDLINDLILKALLIQGLLQCSKISGSSQPSTQYKFTDQ